MKIKFGLFVIFLIISLIPIVVLSGIVFESSEEQTKLSISNNVKNTLKEKSSYIFSGINTAKNEILVFANTPAIFRIFDSTTSTNPETGLEVDSTYYLNRMTGYWSNIMNIKQEVNAISLYDLNYNNIAMVKRIDNVPTRIVHHIASSDTVSILEETRKMKPNQIHISEIQLGKKTVVITYATPIFVDNELKGVVLMSTDPTLNIFDSLTSSNSEILLADSNGLIISNNHAKSIIFEHLNISQSDFDESYQAFEEEKFVCLEKIFYSSEDKTKFLLIGGISNEKYENYPSFLIPFLIISFSSIGVVSLFVSRQMQRKEETIIEQFDVIKMEKEKTKTEKLTAIGSLAARLAHDLRNPLSIIQVSMENLKTMYGADEAKNSQFEKVERSIDRIAHQVEDVLDFVREQPLTLEKIKISEIMHESLDSIKIPNDINLVLPKNDLEFVGDKKRLAIAIDNLILNSIQSIEGDGMVAIDVNEKNDSVIIKIQDSGSGIPKDKIDTIFEPLFTTKQRGTGLGLASVKSIVDAHGGTISVTSPPTIFTITLPKKSES